MKLLITKYLASRFFPYFPALTGLVTSSFLLFAAGFLRGQEQPKDSLRVLDVAPQKWKEYSERFQFFSGEVTSEAKIADFASSDKFTVKGNAACALVIGKNQLWAYNSAYAFKLKRKDVDANWAIESLDLQHEKNKNNLEHEIRKGPLHSLRNILTVGPTSLPDLVNRKTFVIKKSTRVIYRGRNAVEIEFDNKHPLNEDNMDFCPDQSGILILDSGAFWVILSCKVKVEYSDSHGGTNEETEYAYDGGGYPNPIRRVSVRELTTEQGEKLVQTFTKTWNLREGVTARDDYTLSAVGLPEPVGMPSVHRGGRWYIWLAWTALGVVVFGSIIVITRNRYFRLRQPEIARGGESKGKL